MKTVIKKYLLLIIGLQLSTLTSWAMALSPSKDTIIVKLKNNQKVIIVATDHAGLKQIQQYDFNKILLELDSIFIKSAKALQPMDNDGKLRLKDTTFQIKIFKYSEGANSKELLADSLGIVSGHTFPLNRTIIIEQKVDKSSTSTPSFNQSNKNYWDAIEFDIGFNNYLENGQTPDANGAIYGLNTLRSVIVAGRYLQFITLTPKTRRSSLYFGIELASNNYRFEEARVRMSKTPEQVSFHYDSTPGLNSQKSKLAITWLQLPVGLSFKLGKHLEWNIGCFAGYRLSSHNKIKYTQEGTTRKEKNHSNFYLNNIQYGLRTSVRYNSDVGLFFQYQGNHLFAKQPQLTPFAFGFSCSL